MKKQFVAALFSVLITADLSAQVQSEVLDNYISQALESNLALQQRELSYEKSLAALREAKSMFMPKLSLEARYTVARGGRAINFPVGDLLNSVYGNLNVLNEVNSQNPDFPDIEKYPTIQNQTIDFLRTKEHETMFRLLFPVFNAAIIYNNRIQKDLSQAEKISVDIYKKELIKEVKIAYFNYLKATQGVELFENTKDLVKENLRTTKSLYNNHKVTIDAVYSAETQVKGVEQQAALVYKNQQTAAAFFNFLLNREFDDEIIIEKNATILPVMIPLEDARNRAFSQREELLQLNHYMLAAENNIKLYKGNSLPQINLVADYGIQGETYAFNTNSDFARGSLVLSWNLFDRPNRAKVQQVQIEKDILQNKIDETQQQIGLQVVNAYYELEAAMKTIDLSKSEVESSKKTYNLVYKKYLQGQANVVELTTARTDKTNAQMKLIISKFEYLIKQAEFERAASINTYN